MKLSVVIASYNRCESLRRCVVSLMAQELPIGSFEVVVVLDGSTDGSREMLAAMHYGATLVVLEQDNQGPAVARNAGARASKGDILLFLDDDLTCAPNLLSIHLAAHSCGVPEVIFGQICVAAAIGEASLEERTNSFSFQEEYEHFAEKLQLEWPIDIGTSPNSSMPRESFFACGGFDAGNFPWRLEDWDLGLSLWKHGLAFRYEPRAICWHYWLKSDEQAILASELDGVALVALCRKHPEVRCYVGLAAILGWAPWKRLLARFVAAYPVSVGALLGIALSIAKALPFHNSPRSLSERIFIMRKQAAWLSGVRRGAGSWGNLRKLLGPRVSVLVYHHVGSPTPHTLQESITVSPAKFERHLRWLRWRGYTAITPSMWLAWREEAAALPKKPIMLTFDDGYSDLIDTVLPILRRHGFSAAAFVITGKTGGRDTWEGLSVLTPGQIQECQVHGIEIGGHSRSHRELTGINESEVADEVAGSRQDLHEIGLTPIAFAYPYGLYDMRIRAVLSGCYELAFTCNEGLNDLGTDPLLLRRTMVPSGDTLLDIELRAALGWSPLTSLRSALRVRSRARRFAHGLMRLIGIQRQEV